MYAPAVLFFPLPCLWLPLSFGLVVLRGGCKLPPCLLSARPPSFAASCLLRSRLARFVLRIMYAPVLVLWLPASYVGTTAPVRRLLRRLLLACRCGWLFLGLFRPPLLASVGFSVGLRRGMPPTPPTVSACLSAVGYGFLPPCTPITTQPKIAIMMKNQLIKIHNFFLTRSINIIIAHLFFLTFENVKKHHNQPSPNPRQICKPRNNFIFAVGEATGDAQSLLTCLEFLIGARRLGVYNYICKMAKGIEMNGMLRGKRGGNVYYRKNGEQVSRARNTEPTNPRSNKQLYQRAVMATCMRMYSIGKVIFDHSFQGRKKGSANQSRFMALNAKLVRNGIAAQVNSNADNLWRVVGPGVVAGVVNPIQVSEGTYQNRLLSNDGVLKVQATAGETIADYCRRAGIISGDIYTWIRSELAVQLTQPTRHRVQAMNVKGKQFVTAFNYAQVKVKADILSNTKAITADTQYSEIFEAGNYNTSDIQLDAKLIGQAGLFIGDGLDSALTLMVSSAARTATCVRLPRSQQLMYGLSSLPRTQCGIAVGTVNSSSRARIFK